MDQINDVVTMALRKRSLPDHLVASIAQSCAWLEACKYPGVKLLLEALSDPPIATRFVPDRGDVNLQFQSCVFIGPQLISMAQAQGRIHLRNVRHGLYLLPLSVEANIGIGCPIDAAFTLGGARNNDLYGEKLRAAQAGGLQIDDAIWSKLLRLSEQPWETI